MFRLALAFRIGHILAVRVLRVFDTDIHDNTAFAALDIQTRILYIRCLFTENGSQQTLFRSKFRLGLRSNFTDENIARLHFRAESDDSVDAEISQKILADVRNIAGDLFGTEFRIAARNLELINMNTGINIFFHKTLTQNDSVLEVISAPRHESNEHVLAERKLSLSCRRPVGNRVSDLDDRPFVNRRPLIDTCSGIAAKELDHAVNHRIRISRFIARLAVRRDNDFGGGNFRNNTIRFCAGDGTRVNSHFLFQSGSDIRRFRNKKRNCLSLHVRAHQRTVRVVMLKERDQACRGTAQLFRGNVHVLDFFTRSLGRISIQT